MRTELGDKDRGEGPVEKFKGLIRFPGGHESVGDENGTIAWTV